MLYSSMKGNKRLQWYNLYDNFSTHLAIQVSFLTIILIMWMQISSVISGQNMEGTGKKRSLSTYIISTKSRD